VHSSFWDEHDSLRSDPGVPRSKLNDDSRMDERDIRVRINRPTCFQCEYLPRLSICFGCRFASRWSPQHSNSYQTTSLLYLCLLLFGMPHNARTSRLHHTSYGPFLCQTNSYGIILQLRLFICAN
jgi:hypothetical protein